MEADILALGEGSVAKEVKEVSHGKTIEYSAHLYSCLISISLTQFMLYETCLQALAHKLSQ